MHAKTNDPIQGGITVAINCDLYSFFSHWIGRGYRRRTGTQFFWNHN